MVEDAWGNYEENTIVQEKIKIITDGECAEVYVDGKKVRCTDIDLEFHGHINEQPMIACNAMWHKVNECGNPIVKGNQILTEGIRF